MPMKQIAFAAALFGALAAPAFAQAPAVAPSATPTRPVVTAPAVTTPAVTMPAVTTPATKPAVAAKMVNVNTADAKELDKLPGIGKARAKVILAERAKGSFKDWADFDKRLAGSKVSTGERTKIKDMVTF